MCQSECFLNIAFCDETSNSLFSLKNLWPSGRDDGIWFTADSACNTSCHSTPWRENADRKLAEIGRFLRYHDSEFKTWWHKKVPHDIDGLGNSKSHVKGSRLIPMATTTLENDCQLAKLVSEEIPEGRSFLFGIDLQRQLKISVDTLEGRVYRKLERPNGEIVIVNMETAQHFGFSVYLICTTAQSVFRLLSG